MENSKELIWAEASGALVEPTASFEVGRDGIHAMALHVARELLGLRELLSEIEFIVVQPIKMLMDNWAAIKQLKSEGSMLSAKHVDVRLKFVCNYARKGGAKPDFVESRLMKADILTEMLPAPLW